MELKDSIYQDLESSKSLMRNLIIFNDFIKQIRLIYMADPSEFLSSIISKEFSIKDNPLTIADHGRLLTDDRNNGSKWHINLIFHTAV